MQSDEELTALIKKKFAIKCTTGYSINALVDHDVNDPIEIIKRLMIGSEGTLGFVSQATYKTVVDHPHKASAFIVFQDVEDACKAAAVLRRETDVDAVELFDRASLTQCEDHEKIMNLVPTIKEAPKVRRRASHRVPRRDGGRVERGRRRSGEISRRRGRSFLTPARGDVPVQQGGGRVQGVLGRS